MTRILALLLLAACAAPSPIPGGDKPAWVSTPNGDLRFPPDRFIAAVGSVPMGQKPAPEVIAAVDAAARAAVVSQLSAAAALGFNVAAGVKVEARWRQGDTAYAWAVFDRAGAQAQQAAKVSGLQKSAADLLAQGEAAESDHPVDALRDYAKARSQAAEATEDGKLLAALGGKPETPNTQAEAESHATALAAELTLSVAEGDRQLGVPGKPLPQPIVVTAWIKGKKAAGLPMAVNVPGGRAAGATVGEDGRASVQIEDAGKVEPVVISLDWPALLGTKEAPAWANPVSVTVNVLRRSVPNMRVLVLAAEHALDSALTGALSKAGFPVQDGKELMEKYGAGIVKMTDAQLRDAGRRTADVVVVGSVAGGVHALEVSTGRELFRAPAGKGVSAALTAALSKAAAEP